MVSSTVKIIVSFALCISMAVSCKASTNFRKFSLQENNSDKIKEPLVGSTAHKENQIKQNKKMLYEEFFNIMQSFPKNIPQIDDLTAFNKDGLENFSKDFKCKIIPPFKNYIEKIVNQIKNKDNENRDEVKHIKKVFEEFYKVADETVGHCK